MRRWRAVLIAGLLAAVAWGAVARLGDDDAEESSPVERPERLVDARPATLESVEVTEPGTGRAARLEVDDETLVVVEGATVGDDELAQLRTDLAPLLGIRLLTEDDPAFNLDDPRLEVAVSAAGEVTRFVVGDPNFDDTGFYVRVDDGRIALVLPRVVDTLTAALA